MAEILIGNIKGPQGPQGIQGIQGPVGPTGPQGPLPPLVSDLLATEAGKAALDAVVGKMLDDKIKENKDLIDRLNSDVKIYNAQQTPIYDVLKSRTEKITFLRFSKAPDNPFSFSTGYVIAFNSSYSYTEIQFLLLGLDVTGEKIELKLKTFSQ